MQRNFHQSYSKLLVRLEVWNLILCKMFGQKLGVGKDKRSESFDCYCQSYFLEGRLDVSLCSNPILKFSYYFLNFELKSFGKSWENSYKTFINVYYGGYHVPFYVWIIWLYRKTVNYTTWKVSVFGVFLIRVF